MRILLLAPHPFYQERGTPIAVDLLIRALTERGDEVDLLTYHEGVDRTYNGLRIYRIRPWPSLANLRPGFSLKKIYCDIFMFFKFIRMMSKNNYDIVHAVEESAFMAMLVCPFASTRYIYDIDSSMTTQLVDKLPLLKPIRELLRLIESLPMRYAEAVVPMCDALAEEVARYRDRNIVVLKDVSLIKHNSETNPPTSLRTELDIQGKLIMYIGNLETYQGIDLLLDSFEIVMTKYDSAHLVIIGGAEKDISNYRDMSQKKGIDQAVHLLGPRPVSQIGEYMAQADVLVSPRTQGANTPMKVYSYLDSGVAVLATRLATHTQVMNDDMAMLAEPETQQFADAMLKLLTDNELCEKLAREARATMQRDHSYDAFKQRVHGLFEQLEIASR